MFDNVNTFYNSSAGTGKTYQLTDKYINLILEKNIDPHEILLMTFTKNAAAELKSEVIKKLSFNLKESNNISEDRQRYLLHKLYSAPICTIDAYCNDILQQCAIDCGISPNFKLVEDDEYQELLEEISHQKMLEFLSKDKNFFKFCSGMRLNSIGKFSESSIPKTAIKIIKEATSIGIVLDDKINLVPNPEIISIEDFKLLYEKYKNKKVTDAAKEINIKLETYLKKSSEKFDILKLFYKDKTFTKNTKIARELSKLIEKVEYEKNHSYFISFSKYIKSIFRAIEDYKFKKNILTFDDIKYHAINIINNKIYEPKFKYIIIDEVQDISNIQYELIKTLWTKNITIITCGDSKQSIYSWRNADSKIMSKVYDEIKLSGGKIKPLQKSFRTKKSLIDPINKIFSEAIFHETKISRNMQKNLCYPDYENEKLLPNEKINANVNDPNSIEYLLRDEEYFISDNSNPVVAEMTALARRISLLIRSNDKKWVPKYRYNDKKFQLTNDTNKYTYSDILILLKKQTNLSILQEALKKENIPYIFQGKGTGLFSSTAAKDLSLLLTVVFDSKDDFSLIGLLRSPWFNISDEEIASKLFSRKDESIISLFPKVNSFLEYYKNLISLKLVSEISRECIEELHYDNFLYSLPDGDQQVANLRKIIDWIRKKERNINNSPYDLVRKLKKFVNEPPKSSEANINDINLNAVKIMTVHSSKGLTERIVCIPELDGKPSNDQSFAFLEKINKIPILNIKLTTLNNLNIRTPNYEDAKNIRRDVQAKENINLFYVAMTRARDLIILSSKQKLSDNPIRWMKHIHKYLNKEIKIIDYNNLKNTKLKVEEKIDSRISSNELSKIIKKNKIKRLNSNFERIITSSITKEISDDNYCIEREKIKNIGILGHTILENAAKLKWNINIESEINKHRHQYNLIEEDTINLKEKLIDVIDIMIKETQSSKELIAEYPFLLKSDDKLIDGVIDLISISKNKISIYDYKFSNILPCELIEKYKDQLYIYSQAVKNKYNDNKEIELYLISISDKKSELVMMPILSS